MKCKDIETLIIESSGEFRDLDERETVFSHIEQCRRCSRLKEEMENMRSHLQQDTKPNLPEDLDKATYLKCLNELHSLQNNKKKSGLQQQIHSIPIYMKIVFVSLLVLTVFWIFPIFKDFGLAGDSLSVPTIFGLFWIIQNVMMLLFAPLLIRRYHSKKMQHTIFSIGG